MDMKNRLRPSDQHHQKAEHAEEHDPFAAEEPSWFFNQANQQPRDELVSRYRLSRHLPERPAQRDHHKRPEHREPLASRPRPPARFLEVHDDDHDTHSADHPQPGLSLKQTFALAAFMAVLSGGTVGFLSSQYSTMKESAFAMLNGTTPTAAVQPAPVEQKLHTVAATIVPKKPIATATLEVSDVTGETNSLIPLLLAAEPAAPSQDLVMKISGLPDSAYLTSGTRDQDKVWALTVDDLKDVKLMVPEAREREIDLAVAAFEKDTGELAAPMKTMTVALSNVIVQPVAAAPPAASGPILTDAPKTGHPGAIPEPINVNVAVTAAQQIAAQNVTKGDSLMKSGDLAGARKAYEQAWNGGSPDGALGLAKTYDPVALSALKVEGASANSEQALAWYQRAATAGKTEALSAIVRLRMKPK
jgi:hypothetical protein